MKILYVILLLLLISPDNGFGTENKQNTGDENYVVIISIDGFPSEALWDDRVPIPAVRSLANNGAWSEAMIPSTPTVTWPNHTSITTGVHPEKHGILTNGRFLVAPEGITRENDLDRDELSTYPTLYDYAFDAGMKTAEVNWPVTRNARTLHYSLPDAIDPITHTTPELREELISLGLLQDGTNESFRAVGSVARDYIWTSTAIHLIESQRPNVLLLHLLNVDGTHHAHGSGTRPGFTALAFADTQVKRLLDTLEREGIKEQTTFFIVSDHGFMNVTHQVHPNILLRQHDLIDVDDNGDVINSRVLVVSNGGSAMVFATNPETQAEDLEKAYSIFSNVEGISKVVTPDEFRQYGLPQPDEVDGMGDLVLNAAQGHSFGNSVSGDDYVIELDGVRGTHGYLNAVPEMETVFVASGNGIQTGVELEEVDIRSIATTAAYLLGLEMDTSDGELLRSILN